jgi:hypothetical protein
VSFWGQVLRIGLNLYEKACVAGSLLLGMLNEEKGQGLLSAQILIDVEFVNANPHPTMVVEEQLLIFYGQFLSGISKVLSTKMHIQKCTE